MGYSNAGDSYSRNYYTVAVVVLLAVVGCGQMEEGAVTVEEGAVTATADVEATADIGAKDIAADIGDQTAGEGGVVVGPVQIEGGAFLAVAVVVLVLGVLWFKSWRGKTAAVRTVDLLVAENEQNGGLGDDAKLRLIKAAVNRGVADLLRKRVRQVEKQLEAKSLKG